MAIKSGFCVKTGAFVKVLDYGRAQVADVFLVGDCVVIKLGADLFDGDRVEGPTSHAALIGATGFYDDQTSTLVVPKWQFKGKVFLGGATPTEMVMGEPKPARLVIDITGGAVQGAWASHPARVMFLSSDSDDVEDFDGACMVPPSQGMARPEAWWLWDVGTPVPALIEHYFDQLED